MLWPESRGSGWEEQVAWAWDEILQTQLKKYREQISKIEKSTEKKREKKIENVFQKIFFGSVRGK